MSVGVFSGGNFINSLQAAGKNQILNSNFGVWQRGTSLSVSASTSPYTADRWQLSVGANQASTVSRQATNDTTNLPNIQYCARVQRNSGQTGVASNLIFVQSFETANSIPYANKEVTLSFYARKGADYSPTSSFLTSYLVGGTGTDQNGIAGYAGQTTISTNSVVLTTTWKRFSATVTIGSTITELNVRFDMAPTGTASTNDYYEITGVQLEVGSVASNFTPNGSTYQGELAACQRYYFRATAGAAGQHFANGNNQSTTLAVFVMPFPTIMRIAPTALEQSGTAGNYSVRHQATSTTASAVPAFESASTYAGIFTTTVSSGLTAGNGSFSRPVSSSAYLGWSAEL
jgi:hypothetical protein